MPDTQKEYNKMSESEKKKEDWMNSKWRPMMGWMYMTVCIMDFVIFPIFWSLLQAMNHGRVETQWNPLTLQGAGLFHMAMGAVLGLAAFGRTQEKLAGVNNGGLQQSTGFSLPSPTPTTSGGFNTPGPTGTGGFNTGGFGGTPSPAPTAGFGGNSGFGAPASAEVVTGFGGKPAPVIPPFPEK